MKVCELFDTESRWTQGYYAKSSNDENVSPTSKHAVKWCLFGAIEKCYRTQEMINEVTLKIEEKLDYELISHWNDDTERTFKEVYDLVHELNI